MTKLNLFLILLALVLLTFFIGGFIYQLTHNSTPITQTQIYTPSITPRVIQPTQTYQQIQLN